MSPIEVAGQVGSRRDQVVAAEPQGSADRYHAIDNPIQDALFRLVLSLGAEVWVMKDRLRLLEEALSERGIEVSALIEELSAKPERLGAVRRERDAFLGRFLGEIELGADR
jgi:hypothetical protein